jgi:hypothetical protein
VVRDIRGYPDRCIPLPSGADDATINQLCSSHTVRLRNYLDQLENAGGLAHDDVLVSGYNGSVGGAIMIFRCHSLSPFNEVAANTQKTYNASLKVIESTVAARAVQKLTLVDLKRGYKEWRKPAISIGEDGNEVVGPEHVDRAHDAVQLWRQVLRFGSALGFKDCAAAIERLGGARFERGKGRSEEMNYAQAFAFVRKSLELGESDVIPADRALCMAVGVAAQFEMGLRQRDIIGKWMRAVLNTPHAEYDGAGEMWTGAFRWNNIPGWKFRLKTSKTKAASGFTLTDYPLLFPLLERVPHSDRQGAIVKGEGGLAVRERSYRKWFRQIARAAEIPDSVWNMDARAGAATEADDAGVKTELIQDLLTHNERAMTQHYIRRRERGNREVAQARAEHRQKQQNGS